MNEQEIKNRIEELENQIDTLYKSNPEDENESFNWWVTNIKPLDKEIESLKYKLWGLANLNVQVGEGVTIRCWTDSYAYTVISRTPKTITIQRDNAIRTDKNGMCEIQEYRYERNPKGEIRTMRWSEKKHCWVDKCYIGYIGRDEYYDFSF